MSHQKHRYLASLPRGDGKVFLSWRLLYEDDPVGAFQVERRPAGQKQWNRITTDGIIESTNYLDVTPKPGRYEYRVMDAQGAGSESVAADSAAEGSLSALEIPIDPECTVSGIVLGDLCNNGRMGFVVRVMRGKTIWILAYSHEGDLLWEMDTNIPQVGGWDGSTLHVPMLCWDVNNDGRTEVVFRVDKEYSGVEKHDGTGLAESLIAVDAQTGRTVWKSPFPGTRARVMMTLGHLKGLDQPPAIVVQDETYRDVVLTAVDGAAGDTFWTVKQSRAGGHNLDIGDIDLDGVQEVICGGVCYNGDGSIRWEAEPFGHTDISKPAWIDPYRDGPQIWYAVEKENPGVYLVDNQGKTIFKEAYRHAHFGWIARHTADISGLQPHTAEDARHEFGAAKAGAREEGHFPIFLPDGTHWLDLTDWQRKNFVPVHWDAGPEVVFITRKENKRVVRLLPDGTNEDLPDGKLPESGQYGRNIALADVIGDFRENIVTVDSQRNCLIVLANPTACNVRGYSPYEDFEYRHDRSQHGSGYYIYLSPPDTAINR
jgi:hypothetical protein